jgi:hypothetical protein
MASTVHISQKIIWAGMMTWLLFNAVDYPGHKVAEEMIENIISALGCFLLF